MTHFQQKIEEMKRKLNIINENIEQIKNGRKTLEENKINNKNNDFLKYNIKKNNNLKEHNNSINYFNKKKVINQEFNSVSNYKKNIFYKNKYSDINLINNHIYDINKKSNFKNSDLNIINEAKYINYENNKNETPTFFRNTKNYRTNITNERILNNNECLNNNKIRKSTSEIFNSTSIIKGHERLKKNIKEKRNKNNKNIPNKMNTVNVDYNMEDILNNSTKKRNNKSLIMEKSYSYNNINKHQRNYNTNIENRNNKEYSSISSNRTYLIEKRINNKYEKIIYDIINETNKYNKIENKRKNKININNIFQEYKLILHNNKIKNEFIFKLFNLYNKHHDLYLGVGNIESFISVYKWFKKKCDCNKEKENDEYKNLCLNIMKQYNLQNIEQLKIFINKMLKKVDNNEYFLEGIKKILLP